MALLPVTNVTELQAMDFTLNDYYLSNDIDATITNTWNAGAGFAPVTGNCSPSYFDGRGFTIKNLYINRPSEDYVGLFNLCPDVYDVFLEDISFTGHDYLGAIAGWLPDCPNIVSGCKATGKIINPALVFIPESIGGLIGYIDSGANVLKSCSKLEMGAISSHWAYGTLAGQNHGTITDCFSIGSIGETTKVPDKTGGLVGVNTGTINRCFSAVCMPTKDSIYFNGFVGHNWGGSIQSSFWDTEVSGVSQGTEPVSDPPTGKTTAQMKQEATFAGWDFCRTWKIIEGVTYPMLRTGKKKQRVRRST